MSDCPPGCRVNFNILYITFLGSTIRNNEGLAPLVLAVSHLKLSDTPIIK